ncbi:MFS transporter [Patescibacteria group bacterium]|nr:MFS transporter [Patescibacteria group bacterium]MBU2035934.1 MFS transporter [Patescibacteria group bacterium]
MFIKKPEEILKNSVWSKVITLSLVLFFILLGDAILSFWVPNLLHDSLENIIAMGFIISFSSVIGLGTDLILPQLIKGISVRKLLILAIITSIIFSLLLIKASFTPLILIFLFGMVSWGLYYEFLGFAQQQFVADSVPLKLRSGAWGILRVFRSLAYFFGPMIAGWLFLKGEVYPGIFAIGFVLIGYIILQITRKEHKRPIEIDLKEVNLVKEIGHWGVLFKHVWPVIFLSILLGLNDSFFWTIGAIWTEELAKKNIWGTLFLPLYALPSIFMGFVVVRLKIYKGKKKLAIKFFFLSGIFLAVLGLFDGVFWQLAMVFLSSLMLSVVYPLTDGVYSDIVARMGRERKHMIGLSNSTASLAYIIGPIMAGFLSSLVGEKKTFVAMGFLTMIVSVVLYLLMPKKLKVPQKEIKTWENK